MYRRIWGVFALGVIFATFGCGGSGSSVNGVNSPPIPRASLSPATLTFPTEAIGNTSPAQSAMLSNSGSVSLSITSVAASGDYAQTNNCPTSLPAGANCTIQVTLTPTALGTRTGTLTVSDNATRSQQTTQLSGTSTCFATGAGTMTLYVGPEGNDSWCGTFPAPNANNTNGPFATFDHARAVIQSLDKTGLSQVVVQFREGTYYLPAAEQFTAADSGSASTEIIYENYPGEMPVISGGKSITGWTPSATIPGGWQALVAGFAPFEQLWVNGQRRYRVWVPANSPSGYFYNLGPVYVSSANGCTNSNYPAGYSPAVLVTSGPNSGQYQCFDRFFFTTGDINPNWSGLADANSPIEILDFEEWTIARMRLQSVGSSSGYGGAPPNSSVGYLVGATATGRFWGFLPGHRYLIDNVKDVLSSSTPGQWYVDLDAAGNPSLITYIPAPGEDFVNNPPTVIAPQVNQLIVANDPAGLAYVTFKGLTFSHANWVAGSPGYSTHNGGQNVSGSLVPAALSFTNASHITLDSVIVSHVGGWGAEFVGTNSQFATPGATCSSDAPGNCNNQILNSEFTDLGSGAIRFGTDPASTDTDANVAQYNLLYNTVLAGGDRMLPGVAVVIGNAHNNTIDHNDIYDFYNSGINLGSALNFDAGGLPNWVHDNQVTYNHIYQLGQGVTNDMGLVHTATGLATGNLIEHNTLHDITHDPGPGGHGGWGIYLDQGSSFLTVMDNLVYNASATGLAYTHSLGGTYQLNGTPNLIQNNIFAFSAQTSFFRNQDDNALNFTFKNNIVYWDLNNPPSGVISPQAGAWGCNGSTTSITECFDFESNLYYSTADPSMTTWRFITGLANPTTYTLSQWQGLGEDLNSTVTVDPLFVCPSSTACSGSSAFNFNLQSGSQAPTLINFQPFDPSQAGRANPLLMPQALPPAFPLQPLASY